jgi:hypothetical protein
MERHCKTYLAAIRHFLSGRERQREWYLRKEKPLEEFDPKKNPNPGHEDVQGMLLELGKIYGYETWRGVNDAKKKFMGRPRKEIVIVRDFPSFFPLEGCKSSELISRIKNKRRRIIFI